ncbi:hypothetical protein ACJ5NV_09750 [Loktanella agnita]|uniref:hypothetical protein n=1 Tax=Loktanella agnita TaxID=287097 RepID=UPI003987DECB
MSLARTVLSTVFCTSLIAACDQAPAIGADPALPLDDPRQETLVLAECAIYFAAEQKLAQDGQSAKGSMTANCPEEARARPADINPMVSVPSITPGYPETLYQRMIARGMPQALADDVAKSRAFWNLVAARDSVLLL